MSNEQLTMNKEKRRKLSYFFLLSFLIFFSCKDPVSSVNRPLLPAGKGSFSLTISGAGRTVLPDTPTRDDIAVYELVFTLADDGGAAIGVPYTVDRANETLEDPILLEPGTYNLVINAYKDSGKLQLAARGTPDGVITIIAGRNTARTVTLKALFSGGTGTFTWAITVPQGVTTASMKITPANAGGTNEETVSLHLNNYTGSRTLNSGQYNLTFNLESPSGRVVWKELLYVYQNLVSDFTFEFTNAYFINANYTVTFNSNGGSNVGEQSVLHGGTVTPPVDPIKRGYAFSGWHSDTTLVSPWDFNTAIIDSFTLYAKWELVNVVPGETLATKLNWLQNNAQSDVDYTVEVNADEVISPHILSYSGRTNIGIILWARARRIISLLSTGSMFVVESDVTLVLDDNITLQGRGDNTASLVEINSGGTLLMNTGSAVTDNTSSSRAGGGVYLYGGTFTMSGGEISGNTVSPSASSSFGGGVCVNGGTFTMICGKISGNTAYSSNSYASNGGGVFVEGGIFTMSGGEISSNTAYNSSYANGSGGGVYVNGAYGGTFSKTGNSIITGWGDDTANGNVVKNSSGTVLSNRGHAVYATRNSITKRKETTAGSGVNLYYHGGPDSSIYSGEWDNYIISFSPNGGNGNTVYQSINAGSDITLPGGSSLSMLGHTFGGWNENAEGTGTTYTAGSTYIPNNDTTLYAKWEHGKPVVIVPGATLADKLAWLQASTLSNVDYTVEVSVNENIAPNTLSYSDRSNIGIILTGTGTQRVIGLLSTGSLFTVESGVTLVLSNNITLQGSSNNNTCLVRVNEGGSLLMNTGSVVSGNASGGGGVNVLRGTFTMNGGTISGNTHSYGGGGVNVLSGTFTMNGGTISGNTVSSSISMGGGGVYVQSGTFTMNGGTISGNTVVSSSSSSSIIGGGGVYVLSGTFTMNGGTISGNTASICGGGVYMSGGTFIKTGSSIITGWGDDTVSGNAVKNSSGMVVNNNGHAVCVRLEYSLLKRKESTAGSGVNLWVFSRTLPPTWSEGWDN